MVNEDETSSDHEISSYAGSSDEEENAPKETTLHSSSSEAINQDSTPEEASQETDEEEEKKSETCPSVSNEEAEDKETSLLSSRTHQEEEEAEAEAMRQVSPSSDVDSSSSEAEETKQDSVFRYAWFEDSAPLGSDHAALRRLHEKFELIDINACVLESLRRRRRQAIKLGVALSLLVVEAMFFSTNIIPKITAETFQGFLKEPLQEDSVVVFYLTQLFKAMATIVELPLAKLRAELFDPSYFDKFSDAMAVLERVISGNRDVSDTVVLQEEPEKLSALDSAIEDCGEELRKIEVVILEAKLKQLGIKRRREELGIDDQTKLVVWMENLEEDLFKLWSHLFPAAWSPDTDSDKTDGDETDGDGDDD